MDCWLGVFTTCTPRGHGHYTHRPLPLYSAPVSTPSADADHGKVTLAFTVIGLVANFSNLTAYENPNTNQNAVLASALKVSMAWGACTFAVNTTLTVMILARIMCVSACFFFSSH